MDQIEDDSEAKSDQVRKFAAGKVHPTTGGAEGRFTRQTVSDDGRDALTMANELVERCKLS